MPQYSVRSLEDMKSYASIVLRVGISVGLLWFLFARVGTSTLIDTASQVQPTFYAASIILSTISIALSAWKWKILLEIPGNRFSFVALWKYLYIGKFFNAFVPTSFGGDPVRMYYVYENHDAGAESVTSVVLDRVIGLFAILLTSGIAAILAYRLLPWFITRTVIAISVGGIGLMLAVFLLGPRIPLLESVIFQIEKFRIGHRLEKFFRSLYGFRDDIHALVFALILSIVFRLMLVLNNYVIAVGMGLDIRFVYFLVFIPIVELLLAIPISVQGFGVREVSYVYFFGLVGIPNELAFAFGFVMQVLQEVITSAVGGIVYGFDKLLP